MKKFIVASLALGAIFAFMPSVLADSFGYQASGSIVAANSAFDARPIDFAKGGAESSVFGDGDSSVFGASHRALATADVLVDIRGNEINLLSGHFGGYKAEGRGNGHVFFANAGSDRVGNEISKGNSELTAETATLAATPEPGSLLLLGTGLLCLAFFLFRKSAKQATES
jgi:hypothetical protein